MKAAILFMILILSTAVYAQERADIMPVLVREAPGLLPDMPECPADAPVACDNGKCVAYRGDCEAAELCPTGFEEDIMGRCVAEEKFRPNDCQSGYTLCSDGTCKAQGHCLVPPTCACPESMVMCRNGLCARDISDCPSAVDSCPEYKRFRCPSGACVSDVKKCEVTREPVVIEYKPTEIVEVGVIDKGPQEPEQRPEKSTPKIYMPSTDGEHMPPSDPGQGIVKPGFAEPEISREQGEVAPGQAEEFDQPEPGIDAGQEEGFEPEPPQKLSLGQRLDKFFKNLFK